MIDGRRIADYSAGTVPLSLVSGEEKVGLVFNKGERKHMLVPDYLLKLPRYGEKIVERRDGEAVVWFDQPPGYGTPFGKAEDQDNGSEFLTAIRETSEEIGANESEVFNRIIEQVSYTEKPHPWSKYHNTVYLLEGAGLDFVPGNISDPLLDSARCGFYPIFDLPLQSSGKPGIYQAALRRIVSMFLMLGRERGRLKRLGAGDTDADGFIRKILAPVHYYNLFSRRMIAMFVQFQREDILLDRLRDKNPITVRELALQMARNLVLWLEGEALTRALEALRVRCDNGLLVSPNFDDFVNGCFERKQRPDLRAQDKYGRTFEEQVVVYGADEDVENLLPDSEKGEKMKRVKPLRDAYGFRACLGNGRRCGKPCLPDEACCADHVGAVQDVYRPGKILARARFSGTNRYGPVIIEELLREGVPLVRRTVERQQELALQRMMQEGGIRVWGENGLHPNVIAYDALKEMVQDGYGLQNIHILDYDEVCAANDEYDRIGDRVIVLAYEYGIESNLRMPQIVSEMSRRPFLRLNVWTNLIDQGGREVHCIEMTGFQFDIKPEFSLKFWESRWGVDRAL